MKAYTDIEQSKRLAEILPPESADMARCDGENVIMTDYISAKKKFSVCGELTITPCWSLAALIEMLPKGFLLMDEQHEADLYSVWVPEFTESHIWKNNPLDAVFEMIIWLKENNKL